MYNISACRCNQWRQFQPSWGKNILTPFCERGQQRPEKSWVANTVPCFSSPSLKPGQNIFCPCLKINAIYKDAASHPTYWSSPTHDTKPSRGMKSPLWMHQSFILWLVKTGYYHRHLFQGRAKIQRYSSSTKILSLCCHRGPDSRVLLLALQKAPGWKGQPSVGCLFSPSVLQSKGTRRETTSLPVSSECHRGWQVLGSLSFKWREGKVFTEPMCISSYSDERRGASVVSTEPKFSSHETVPLPSLLCHQLLSLGYPMHSTPETPYHNQRPIVAARLLLHQQQENSVLASDHLQPQAALEQKEKNRRTFSKDSESVQQNLKYTNCLPKNT